MRAFYEYRKRRLAARAAKIEDEGYEDRSLAYQHLIQLVLWAQRDALLQMRHDGKVSNEVMTKILRELDLEESRLEIPATPPHDPQQTRSKPRPDHPARRFEAALCAVTRAIARSLRPVSCCRQSVLASNRPPSFARISGQTRSLELGYAPLQAQRRSGSAGTAVQPGSRAAPIACKRPERRVLSHSRR